MMQVAPQRGEPHCWICRLPYEVVQDSGLRPQMATSLMISGVREKIAVIAPPITDQAVLTLKLLSDSL